MTNALDLIAAAHKQRADAGLTRTYTTIRGTETVIANASTAMAKFNDYKFSLQEREFRTGQVPTNAEIAELNRLNGAF